MKIMSLGSSKPVIIVNFDGEVIYMSKGARAELQQIKVGQSILDILDLEKLTRLTVFEKCIHLIDVSVGEYNKATVQVCTLENERCIELSFFRNESETVAQKDKALFETYGEYSQIKREGKVNGAEFAEYITETVGKDIRFAHKKISCRVSGASLFTYTEQLKIVTVAIMAVLNEICYKSDFLLEMKEEDGLVYLKISATTGNTINALSQYDVAKAYPNIELRLSYIYEICREKEIDLSVKILNGEISAQMVLEKKGERGIELRFAYASGISIEEIIDIFSYFPEKNGL